jgi:hypothetical protein
MVMWDRDYNSAEGCGSYGWTHSTEKIPIFEGYGFTAEPIQLRKFLFSKVMGSRLNPFN